MTLVPVRQLTGVAGQIVVDRFNQITGFYRAPAPIPGPVLQQPFWYGDDPYFDTVDNLSEWSQTVSPYTDGSHVSPAVLLDAATMPDPFPLLQITAREIHFATVSRVGWQLRPMPGNPLGLNFSINRGIDNPTSAGDVLTFDLTPTLTNPLFKDLLTQALATGCLLLVMILEVDPANDTTNPAPPYFRGQWFVDQLRLDILGPDGILPLRQFPRDDSLRGGPGGMSPGSRQAGRQNGYL